MRICNFEGCEGKHLAKGYCDYHYIQQHRGRKLTPKGFKRTCSINGCNDVHKSLGYCSKHWSNLHERGDALAEPRKPKGVSLHRHTGRYRAYYYESATRKQKSLGYFDTEEEALKVAQAHRKLIAKMKGGV